MMEKVFGSTVSVVVFESVQRFSKAPQTTRILDPPRIL
jgi:hypothetical protein